MHRLTKSVLRSISRDGLLRKGETVLIAVSGGADSMALLHVMADLSATLGVRIEVAHLDHCMRGAVSREDAAFVRRIAASLKLPFHTARRNVPSLARRLGQSLEAMAREARYAFLVTAARRNGAVVIATGHTANDQAETILLRLARGSGTQGLAGIPRRGERDGIRIVRPLLDVPRADVVDYLRRGGHAWREDASNTDPAFLRNRVRHEILPLLERRLNPKTRDALCRTADIVSAENEWMQIEAGLILATCRRPQEPGVPPVLDAVGLGAYPAGARRRVLRAWLLECGVSGTVLTSERLLKIEDLLLGRRRRAQQLGGGMMVSRRAGSLVLRCACAGRADTIPRRRLPCPGECVLPEAGLVVRVCRGRGIRRQTGTLPGRVPAHASISAGAVGRRALYVRSWRPGDRMRPLGMSGSKKLQDIFVDAHVPVDDRRGIPLIECAGEIVWLPGYRVARGWEVGNPSAPALQIDLVHVEGGEGGGSLRPADGSG